jgi:hypothetical protein
VSSGLEVRLNYPLRSTEAPIISTAMIHLRINPIHVGRNVLLVPHCPTHLHSIAGRAWQHICQRKGDDPANHWVVRVGSTVPSNWRVVLQ